MLVWFTEDYAEFVKECENNLESIKTNRANDAINNIYPGSRDWSDMMEKLAKNQLIIAQFMATYAGAEL